MLWMLAKISKDNAKRKNKKEEKKRKERKNMYQK
jgi:hypothetical protein